MKICRRLKQARFICFFRISRYLLASNRHWPGHQLFIVFIDQLNFKQAGSANAGASVNHRDKDVQSLTQFCIHYLIICPF